MKKKIGVIGAAALALGLTLGAPAASMAAGYAPIPDVPTSQAAAPGGTITLSTSNWAPGEDVTITYPDSFTLAGSIVKTASGAGVVTATASGSSAGTFTVSFVGATSGTVNFSVTIDPALAYTGSADPTPYLWLGGGALALGIAAIVTVAVVRRERNAERIGA